MPSPTGKRKGYVEKFFAFNGLGPFICMFCKEPLVLPWENNYTLIKRTDRFTVHHVDEDHANYAKENLHSSHLSCHTKHHSKKRGGWGWNQGRVGKPLVGERRKKHAARMSQMNKSPEARRKASERQKARWANITKEQRKEILRPAFEASKQVKKTCNDNCQCKRHVFYANQYTTAALKSLKK